MKIAIITDMEGVAGVLNEKDWTLPDGRYYEQGKAFLTEETNAAIDGFFAAGAERITVIDGHGVGGINPWLLDERAELACGVGVSDYYGLNADFDALAWIGQHAKAGSLYSHIAHTSNFDVIECKLNDVSVGEFGLTAAIGGCFGAVSLFGSGDREFNKEAKALIPHMHTVEVKYGFNTSDGADCDFEGYRRHTLGAVHIHPKRACALIREGAEKALKEFINNRDSYKPFTLGPPYFVEIQFRAVDNKPPYKITSQHDSDIATMYHALAGAQPEEPPE